jgi:hypothetical protein
MNSNTSQQTASSPRTAKVITVRHSMRYSQAALDLKLDAVRYPDVLAHYGKLPQVRDDMRVGKGRVCMVSVHCKGGKKVVYDAITPGHHDRLCSQTTDFDVASRAMRRMLEEFCQSNGCDVRSVAAALGLPQEPAAEAEALSVEAEAPAAASVALTSAAVEPVASASRLARQAHHDLCTRITEHNRKLTTMLLGPRMADFCLKLQLRMDQAPGRTVAAMVTSNGRCILSGVRDDSEVRVCATMLQSWLPHAAVTRPAGWALGDYRVIATEYATDWSSKTVHDFLQLQRVPRYVHHFTTVTGHMYKVTLTRDPEFALGHVTSKGLWVVPSKNALSKALTLALEVERHFMGKVLERFPELLDLGTYRLPVREDPLLSCFLQTSGMSAEKVAEVRVRLGLPRAAATVDAAEACEACEACEASAAEPAAKRRRVTARRV